MQQNLRHQLNILDDRIADRLSELEHELKRIPLARKIYSKSEEGQIVAQSTQPRAGYVEETISAAEAMREHKATIRDLRCSLTHLAHRRNALEFRDREENPLNYPPDLSKFGLNDVKIINGFQGTWIAYWERRRIGALILNSFSEPEQLPHQRSVFKSGVEVVFQRRGVGRLLYGMARADLLSRGLEFVPSPTRVLSDDAFEFWNKYDPPAVRDDARHWRGQYLQRQVASGGTEWRLISICGSRTKMGFIGQRADEKTKYLCGVEVFSQLGMPSEVPRC
jgi:ribosomal protein S18 acetylase RimI-like enzyme